MQNRIYINVVVFLIDVVIGLCRFKYIKKLLFNMAGRNLRWILIKVTSQGGRMSRAPTSHSARSGNLKIAGSSLEPAALKPG